MIYILEGQVNITGKFAVTAVNLNEAKEKTESFFRGLKPDNLTFPESVILEIEDVELVSLKTDQKMEKTK